MPRVKATNVPKTSEAPIEYLIEQGRLIIDLAGEWGLRSTDAIYKLRRYEHVPKVTTAQRMAETFGWTAGDVINHWIQKVGQR